MENTPADTLCVRKESGFLDRNALKYIVIVTMVLDHVAWGFESSLPLMVTNLFHFVGRLTGPTMAYFLYEGYVHTRDVAKYQKRLGIFAIISWLPFTFFESGIDKLIDRPFFLLQQSVIFTLFLGITALRIWDSSKLKKSDKIVLIVVLCILSLIGDWPVMDVLGPLFLYIYRTDKKKKYIALTLVYLPNLLLVFVDGWYNLGVLLVPIMIVYCYNGKGGSKSAFNKWFFYVFYPLHLIILGILKWYVF
ncbi:MAG: hypothetical protein IJJ76_02805 [Ruminococcus sp.]|uniref:TraX family protein n=1 Tax=Ruminococcus sp. TaxID=41978 RepID=UPI0025D0CBBF|nr:TraX family protein [Ruminococcus sp.]MBR0528678.1 hypothetical protein [Ruminococcus sp.]